jgi:hypothetical protein
LVAQGQLDHVISARLLTVIACGPLISPDTTVSAQSAPFAGVQFTANGSLQSFFDTRTGDLWMYEATSKEWTYFGRVTKLGQPVTK